MNRERLDTLCQQGILALVLGVLIFGPLALGAARLQDFAIIQFLTVGATGLWVFRLWVGENPRLLWPPMCWAVLAFTAYAIGRCLTADIEYVARLELNRVLVYALLYFVIINNLHRQNHTQIIMLALVFLAMAISCYAAYQFLSGSDRVWTFISPYKGRAGGTYICPNHLAGFLEMLLPLALACAVAGRMKTVLKVLAGYSAGVILFGIVVTLSRGGWVATVASLLLFVGLLVLRRGFRLPALVILAVVLIGGGTSVLRSSAFQERFKRAFKENSPTKVEDIRFELWRPAAQIWREHVWIGAGPGHFDSLFGEYRPQNLQLKPDRVHNDYLNTLADWGVAGELLVLGALVLLGWGAVKTWQAVRGGNVDFGKNTSNKFALVLGASVGLAAILVHSFVDFNMQIPANAILAVTLMAMLSGHLRFVSEDYWVGGRLWLKCVATLVLLAGIVYVGSQGWQRWREIHTLDRAGKLPFAQAPQIALLKQAAVIEPENAETAYAIGECYRVQSWAGGPHYEALAGEAMKWFALAMKLNPHGALAPMRQAMCLDWLDRQAEAAPFVDQALRLDGNAFFILNLLGWHQEQLGDFSAARECYERSRFLQWYDNPIAERSQPITERVLGETAGR